MALFDSAKPLPIPEIGNVIFNTQSAAVPFTRLLRKEPGNPNQMLQEWPMELYPDRGYVGTADGADVTSYSHFTRHPAKSFAMLLRTEGVKVTKLAQLTVDAGVGRKQEMARQLLVDGKVLAQMMERSCLSILDMREEDRTDPSNVIPYRSRGAGSWLNSSAQGVNPVHASFRPAEAAYRTDPLDELTPDAVESMLEAMSIQRKQKVDLKVICGTKFKRAMSLWGEKVPVESGEQVVQAFNIDKKEQKFLSAINRFEFDSGSFYTLPPSFYLACNEATGEPTDYSTRSAYFVDTSMWSLRYLQEPRAFENPDLGGGPRAYHDVVFVLACKNPMGQGAWLTNLSEASS